MIVGITVSGGDSLDAFTAAVKIAAPYDAKALIEF
jgi:hypothetical protein